MGLETDIDKIVEKEKPKPKDKPKPKLKKSAAADKPKPKSKKIVAASVTPKEISKENIEPKEHTEKHVEIQKENKTEVVPNETENGEPKEKSEKPEDKETEVVSHESENGELSYEIRHVAAYVNNGETHDTEDRCTEEENIQNIHDAFEIRRLECAIDKVITNRLQVDSSQEKIKRLKDILELLDPDFVKVDFIMVMQVIKKTLKMNP